MRTVSHHLAGLPQLDIHTLSEDWALATALQNHWAILAESVGLPPSRWYDSQGDRMYGAVISLSTGFDLGDPVREDDRVAAETEVLSVRKPHALSVTRFVVGEKSRAEVRLLTSFIKRTQRGSNKKFAKVRELWTAPDLVGEAVDTELDRHHALKSEAGQGPLAMTYEVNRVQDFNTADFLYFKNFVRIAKAAEWRQNRGAPTRLNSTRQAWFYGNVEDGEEVAAFVARNGDDLETTIRDASGRLLFVSRAIAPVVDIAVR
jgi:probable biosynthetic protein (TIGR04098 family)